MGLPKKIPRLTLPGQTAFNKAWADLASAVEYLFNTTSGAGVKVERGATGLTFRADAAKVLYLATVTTTVPAGNGRLTYSSTGRVTVLDDSGSALVAGQLTGLPVKNFHEKSFVSGSVVCVLYATGSWWVFDVGKCADYV